MQHRRITRRLAHVTRELSQILEIVVSERSRRPTHSPDGTKSQGSPLEQAILQALAGGATMPAKQLARRSGYPYNSRFRACMTDLARRGLVVRSPDGCRLGGS